MKQEPGTIPDAPITDALNRNLPFLGLLKAGYQPNAGGPAHLVQAELYGAGGKVEFVLVFDDQPGRPIAGKVDLSIVTLIKAKPELRLEQAFWAYEDRSSNIEVNTLVYFFGIKVAGTQLSRTPAGQLPRKYLYLLLGKK